LSGFTPIEVMLKIGAAQFQPRRATVYHAAECWAVAFAEAGNREELAKSISGHCFAYLC
jgi:hypothetical protein